MADRAPRESWAPEHRVHVFWFEKAIAVLVLVGAYFGVKSTDGVAQYFMVGVASVAVWKLFPSFRPVISGVVDRLPFLAGKSGAAALEAGDEEE